MSGGIIGKRTKSGYPIVQGGDPVVIAPYILEAGTGNDRDGVLALPICTTPERLLMMFSALNVGAELIYPDRWMDASIDFWQALEHVNKPLECECWELFVVYPEWQWDNNAPPGVIRGRWAYPDGSFSAWSPNLRGADGLTPEMRGRQVSETVEAIDWKYITEDNDDWRELVTVIDGINGLTPQLRMSGDDLQWKYANESESAWRFLATITDGLTPQFRMDGDELQWKYTVESSSAWRLLTVLLDGRTPEIRRSGDFLQWKYTDETAWQTLWTVISAVDLDIVAPNQPATAAITGNILTLDIPRARNPEMRASGETIEWRQESMVAWNPLVTVECCEEEAIPPRVTEITDPMRCYAMNRMIAWVERFLFDTLNQYDADLDPLQRTDAAVEWVEEAGRRLLRGVKKTIGISIVASLLESEVSDIELIEASMTITRREDIQRAAYCEILEQNGVFNASVFNAMKSQASANGYSESPDENNWFIDILDWLGIDEVRDRYNLYLDGNTSGDCATYGCNEPDWCYEFDFASFQTHNFSGFATIPTSAGLVAGNYDADGGNIIWRRGVHAYRTFNIPLGSAITRVEIVFTADFHEVFDPPGGLEPYQVNYQAGNSFPRIAQIAQQDVSDYVLTGDTFLTGSIFMGAFLTVSRQSTQGALQGNVTLRKFRLFGSGANPFGANNCP